MMARMGKLVALVAFCSSRIAADSVQCDSSDLEDVWRRDGTCPSKLSEESSLDRDSSPDPETALPLRKNRTFDEMPTFFYVVGHSGGDPEEACENTIESTRLGLAKGMNSVEIDLCMSVDEVIFLWHDPNPQDEWTMARRGGVVKNGLCQPNFGMEVHVKYVPYAMIKKKFTYVNAVTGEMMAGELAAVPTLEEWLKEFSDDSRMKMIWLDIKVDQVERIALFTKRLTHLLTKYNVERKCLLNVYDQKLVNLYQNAMSVEGLDPRRIVADKARSSYFLGPDVRKYSSVSNSIARGTCCATQSKPHPGYLSQEAFEKMVAYDVSLRDAYQNFTGERIKILSWTINDEITMKFLIDIGVDGIITNRPEKLLSVYKSLRGSQILTGEKSLMAANSTWAERCNRDWWLC